MLGFRERNNVIAYALLDVIDSCEPWWPMTLRAYYYQLVVIDVIPNSLKEYENVSMVLTKMRRKGVCPWEAVVDNTRIYSQATQYAGVNDYVSSEMDVLDPRRYVISRQQAAKSYIEISIEKDTLLHLVQRAAKPYGIVVNCTRGSNSATNLNILATRFKERDVGFDYEPVLLHFGDLDPSGIAIPKDMRNGLYKHHGLELDVEFAGLTPEHITRFGLPQTLDSAKPNDPRYKDFIKEYGDVATEQHPLAPKDLLTIVQENIEVYYYQAKLTQLAAKEKHDRKNLAVLQAKVQRVMRNY